MKKKSNVTVMVTAAMIAALYVVLSYISQAFGLASGAVQVRISEVLTILPAFTASAIPGLAIGCFLFNLLSGCMLMDVIVGSIATLLGAIGTYYIGRILKKHALLAYLLPVPPIAANVLLIPPVLRFVYHLQDAYWYLLVTVGVGEVISCGILGMILYFAMKPFRNKLASY